jgi:DNA-directed RNA polymerase subunit M/transcription elongation factor TFIIS
MSTEHALRDYARGKFQELYPGKSIKPRNAELAVYNWAVTHTESSRFVNKKKGSYENEEPSWENRLFRWRYKQRLLSILLNLKNNPDMIKKVKPKELETLTPGQMWPEGPRGQTEKKLREKEMAMAMAKAKNDEEYEGILTCPKCKSKKTSYFQMQCRSADEVSPIHQVTCPIVFFAPSKRRLTIRQPMTNFCNCLCGHRWKFC